MARTRPSKRIKKETLLIVGEGKAECIFLQYLKSLYSVEKNCLAICIRNAQGGNPNAIVNHAIKQSNQAEYDWVIVFMDTDQSWDWEKTTAQTIKDRPIHIIGSICCLEELLLNIFSDSKQSAQDPKHSFEELFKKQAAKFEMADYKKHFSKEKLDGVRQHFNNLDALIKFFEKKHSKRVVYINKTR